MWCSLCLHSISLQRFRLSNAWINCRYHGQLWVPIAGTYSFKLYADMTTRLFVGTANILNSTGEFQ